MDGKIGLERPRGRYQTNALSAARSQFWHHHIEEPAFISPSKAMELGDMVTGEVPTEHEDTPNAKRRPVTTRKTDLDTPVDSR